MTTFLSLTADQIRALSPTEARRQLELAKLDEKFKSTYYGPKGTPGRDIAIDVMTRLYEAANAPAAAAQPDPVQHARQDSIARAKTEIEKRRRDPNQAGALLSGKHHLHRRAQAELTQLYQEAYPEPPAAA